MPYPETLKLKNQICFQLYSTSRKITQYYQPLLAPLDLTYPQYLVMLVLWEENEAVNVKFLGEKLLLDSGTLTPLLQKMEAKDFIKRERSAKDERNVLINLTEIGKSLQGKAENVPLEIIKAMNIDLEEIKNIKKLLESLNQQKS